MKNIMKNKNILSKKACSVSIQLIVLSIILLLSQLTLAKDRIQYHIQNFDGSTLKVINEQGVVSLINTHLLVNNCNIRNQAT